MKTDLTPLLRRQFLAGFGAFLFQARRTEPGLILYTGNILTINSDLPRAQAVAIANARFIAAGSNEDIRHGSTARTRQADLGGR